MNVRLLAKTALLCAVCFVATAFFQLRLPISSEGYINLGQAVVFLLPSFLPMGWAILAGSLGAALADIMLGGAHWVAATIVIKALMVLASGKIRPKWLAYSVATMILAVGYYLYDSIFITKNFISTGISFGFYILEGVICAIIALLLIRTKKFINFTKNP